MADKSDSKSREKWAEANRLILERLDIEAEYRSLGLSIDGRSRPRSTGWLPCHAAGRDDKTASAEINVGDGPARGRYRDFGGDGQSLSLFDFAAKYGAFGADWREARKHFARKADVKLPGGEEELAADRLDFFQLTPGVAAVWAGKKPGIRPQAIFEAGGTGARWPKGLRAELTHHLIAFPAFGGGGLDLPPTGWACVNSTGQKIRIWKGKGNEPDLVKTLNIGPAGLMNVAGLRGLAAARVVWIVEGVTDMLALQSALPADGGAVVLTAGGCTVHPRAEWLSMFAGKDLRIVFDVDTNKAGETGAAVWGAALVTVAASVQVVKLPFEAGGQLKDVRDFLYTHESSYADLLKLSEEFPPIAPGSKEAAVEPHQAILNTLGIVVLGQIQHTDSVEVFSTKLHKRSLVRDINRFSYANAILNLGGEAVDQFVQPEGPGEATPGKFTMAEVRHAIVREGGKKFLSDDPAVGSGIWPVPGGLVLVGPRHADLLNGAGKLEETTTPAVCGQRLDFGGEPWYDREKLSHHLRLAEGQGWCLTQMAEAVRLFARWDNWRRPTAPQLLAGLVAATWVQTCWDFRPTVAVVGPRNCGKTILVQKCLQKIFGGLAIFTQYPSEAGIRQKVRDTAKVILCDEFEDDRHRAEVLKLLRTAGRGGTVLRGSSGQKGSVSYGLKHIAWLSAVNLKLSDAADSSRCIVLDLNHLPDGRPVKLVLPPEAELVDLGQRLLAVALASLVAAKALAERLTRMPFGVLSRTVELFSVPVSMLAVAQGLDDKAAEAFMRSVLVDQVGIESQEKDEEHLILAIYECTVLLPRGKRVSVSQLLWGGLVEDGDGRAINRAEALANYGIRILDDAVFFRPPAMRELISKTDFAKSNINQTLMRIPGASKDKQRIGGHSAWGVSVPIASLEAIVPSSQEPKIDEF